MPTYMKANGMYETFAERYAREELEAQQYEQRMKQVAEDHWVPVSNPEDRADYYEERRHD